MSNIEDILDSLKTCYEEAIGNIPEDTLDEWDAGWRACIVALWSDINE